MHAEIAVFVLNLSDIIFLRTAPHIGAHASVLFGRLSEKRESIPL